MKETWQVGDLCVTRASEDLGGQWANAEIKRIDKDNDLAEVEYIEFGDGEEIPVENLKKFGTYVVNRDSELIEEGTVR